MKDLVSKLIANLHFLFLLYAGWNMWSLYEDHLRQMEDLELQFPSLEAEIATNRKKVKEIQEFQKKTEESKIRVEEVAKNIEAAQRQLPADINDNQILTFFNAEIQNLNIKDPNITPGVEQPSTYFISKDYNLKSKGTFLQMLIFFERIGNATRIYNIKNLKLTNTDLTQRGRFQMINCESSVQAFRFNPDFKVDRGFESAENKP
jgi:Tfp pilus assembly protein PilO